MIWLQGLYSEAAHFGLSVLLGWVALRLISGISSTWLQGEKWIGCMVIICGFGLFGLFHLWLDLVQPWF